MARHYSAKADANQQEIVDAFRALGATVGLIHRAGGGVPDLIVGYRGIDVQIEVKMPKKLKLSEREAEYHAGWRGRPVEIVSTTEQAETLMDNLDIFADMTGL